MDQILAAPLFDPKENYALTDKVGVIRQSDGAYITDSMDNMEWREYLAWRDAGNEPEPYVARQPIPQILSRRQFFQALAEYHVISQDDALAAAATGAIPKAFETIIDAMPEAQKFDAKMLIMGSQIFDRHHPFLLAAAAALGHQDILDEIYIAGAKK